MSDTGAFDERGTGALVRPVRGRIIGGAAAAVADHFGMDPLVIRLAFVALAFVGGIGLFLYAVAWLMIPAEDGVRPGKRRERLLRWLQGRRAWVGVVLLLIGAALVIGQFGLWRPSLFWGVALITLGVVLFRETSPPLGAPGPSGSPVEAHASAEPLEVGTDPTPGHVPGSAGPDPGSAGILPSVEGRASTLRFLPRRRWRAEPPARPALRRPRRAQRERSALGWVTLGAALLAVGIAAGLDRAGIVVFQPVRYLALALAVIGAGLLVGGWRGRARWLTLFGLLLVPAVALASLVNVPLTGGYGTRFVHPLTVDDLRPVYRLIGGELDLDLTQLDLATGAASITASVGVGSLRVLVPAEVPIQVHAQAGGGGVYVFDRNAEGLEVRVDRMVGAAPLGPPPLVLDLAVGIGEITVYPVQVEPGQGEG